MLMIRFNRVGKKNRAHFRLVLQEHTQAPGKRHVEILGSHDPHKKTTILKKDRVLYWLGQGAQASDVVHNLLVKEGIIEGKKIVKKMPRPMKPVAEAPADKQEKPIAETPAVEVSAEGEAAPTEDKKEEVAASVAEEAPKA